MPHPWIYSATLTTDGNINLSVEVTDLKNTTGNIEITGEVTQANGAWARISYVTDIDNATEGDPGDQDQKDRRFMNVEAVPTKDHPFDPSGDFTVWVRCQRCGSRCWDAQPWELEWTRSLHGNTHKMHNFSP